MSDLLAPILVVCGGAEAEAFWCFAALMDAMEGNFHRDQNGMHSQLLLVGRLVEARRCRCCCFCPAASAAASAAAALCRCFCTLPLPQPLLYSAAAAAATSAAPAAHC